MHIDTLDKDLFTDKQIQNLWKPKNRTLINYNRYLRELLKPLITALLLDPNNYRAIIRKFKRSKVFKRNCKNVAQKIVKEIDHDNKLNWDKTVNTFFSNSNRIYEGIIEEIEGDLKKPYESIINYNATKITNLPDSISKDIVNHVKSESLKGRRSEDIANELRKFIPNASEARLRLIARTETSKTSTALTRVRAQRAGINWYIWRTAEDQRVRTSHTVMEGVIVNFNDPPSPEALANALGKLRKTKTKGSKPWKVTNRYNAGDIYNCRCYPEALINLDTQVSWPVKVYIKGTLQLMSKEQFRKVA